MVSPTDFWTTKLLKRPFISFIWLLQFRTWFCCSPHFFNYYFPVRVHPLTQTRHFPVIIIMLSFSTLRRSSPFLARRFSTQRSQIRHASTSSSSSSLHNTANPVRTWFGRNALSTVLAGASVSGLLLYGYSSSHNSEFDSSLLKSSISSLVDRSTPISEDQERRRSFLSKISLPECSGALLFGGKFLSSFF